MTSILECQVWSPFYNVHISSLEGVQRKFLRFVDYKLHILVFELDYGS